MGWALTTQHQPATGTRPCPAMGGGWVEGGWGHQEERYGVFQEQAALGLEGEPTPGVLGGGLPSTCGPTQEATWSCPEESAMRVPPCSAPRTSPGGLGHVEVGPLLGGSWPRVKLWAEPGCGQLPGGWAPATCGVEVSADFWVVSLCPSFLCRAPGGPVSTKQKPQTLLNSSQCTQSL